MSDTETPIPETPLTAAQIEALRAVNQAFAALVSLAEALNRAANKGQEVVFTWEAGALQLEPEVGPTGRRWSRSEPDGGLEFHVSIKPL